MEDACGTLMRATCGHAVAAPCRLVEGTKQPPEGRTQGPGRRARARLVSPPLLSPYFLVIFPLCPSEMCSSNTRPFPGKPGTFSIIGKTFLRGSFSQKIPHPVPQPPGNQGCERTLVDLYEAGACLEAATGNPVWQLHVCVPARCTHISHAHTCTRVDTYQSFLQIMLSCAAYSPGT